MRGRKLPDWTGNALITALISAVVSGSISFWIAHAQSQDSARQAIASQQIQQIVKLETDVQSVFQYAEHIFLLRGQCKKAVTPQCRQLPDSENDIQMKNSELTILGDLASISDVTVTYDTFKFEFVAAELAEFSPPNLELHSLAVAYQALFVRCGQLIQGRS